MMHLLAASDLAGWMVGYYAYPFLVAMAWPWLAVLIQRREQAAPTVASVQPALTMLAVVALTLLAVLVAGKYNPGQIALVDAVLHSPSAAQRAMTDDAITRIARSREALGRIVVDNSVAALRPLEFSRAEIAGWADAPANTIVFFSQGYDAGRLQAAQSLPGQYSVPFTELRIATDRPERTMQALGFVH